MGSSSSKPILIQLLAILLVGGLVGGLANLIHPNRIPWVQDWGNYVEAKAREVGIEVIPLSMAHTIHQSDSHIFVDARPAGEYSSGHIPMAISLPFEELDEQFEALDQILSSDDSVVVYCKNRECDDALLLALELREMGKTNLLYYVDGFELWEESGCPVEAIGNH